jgi:hypothetical protein
MESAQNLVVKIDELNPRKLLKRAKALEEEGAQVYFELGGVLSRIKTGIAEGEDGYKDYSSFTAYVTAEHHMSISQANKMILGYAGLVDKAIPYDKVDVLPWSSLVAIVPALTADNVDEMVAKAQTMSFKEISSLPEVKGAKNQKKATSGAKGGKSKSASKATTKALTSVQSGSASEVLDVPHKDIPAPSPAPAAAPISKGKPLPETTAPIPESMAANFLTSKTSEEAIEWVKALLPKAWAKAVAQAAPAQANEPIKESPEAIAAYNAFKAEYDSAEKTIESAKPNAYKTIDGLMKSVGRAVVLNRYRALFPEVDMTVTGIKTDAAK